MSASPIVSLEAVTKRFSDVQVLDGVTFEILPGRSYAVVGPSGSGKSTLLSIIGLLARPTSGAVTFDGHPAPRTESDAARIRRCSIGWVFQRPVMLPGQTLLSNVMVPARLRGMNRTEAHDRATQALDTVGLSHRAATQVQLLSGGEQQRMETARAMTLGVALVLSDEPTASLDWSAAERVSEALVATTSLGSALVLCTHDARVAVMCDEILRLSEGRIEGERGAA